MGLFDKIKAYLNEEEPEDLIPEEEIKPKKEKVKKNGRRGLNKNILFSTKDTNLIF